MGSIWSPRNESLRWTRCFSPREFTGTVPVGGGEGGRGRRREGEGEEGEGGREGEGGEGGRGRERGAVCICTQ